MPMKKKNRKKLDKLREKYQAKQKANAAQEVDFDSSAYVIYNNLQLTYPCLSFDILDFAVKDETETSDKQKLNFPINLSFVAGAQTPPNAEQNYIYVVKVDNINQLDQDDDKSEDEEENIDEGDEAKEINDEEARQAKLNTVRVPVKGCVNRIRANKISGKTFTATWTDKGKVHINDITMPVLALSDFKALRNYQAQKVENKPVFSFGGHLSEGFALDWSPVKTAALATGDCKKNIHIWTLKSQNNWIIDQQPLVGHTESVEDIKWSPVSQDLLCSCSVDKSIRLWDLRQQSINRCAGFVPEAHSSDVNVIDWNKKNPNLLVSGGDDGIVKVWDVRHINSEKGANPLANFGYHKKPITSVEWNPFDETVFACSSEDDKLTIWDLAVEKDEEQEMEDMKKLEEEKAMMETEDNGDSDDESDDEDENHDEDDDNVKMETEDNENNIDKDEEQEEAEEQLEEEEDPTKGVPEQMLFLHQGQNEIKEIHWHPRINGLVISSALNGFNIFKTISA